MFACRYGIQNKDFWNETLNPEEAWQYYNFGPSGMQNLTQVATLPLFLSKPHFLDGDSSLLAGVKGLNPVRSIHDTYLDIEPNTGALCRVHNRAQVAVCLAGCLTGTGTGPFQFILLCALLFPFTGVLSNEFDEPTRSQHHYCCSCRRALCLSLHAKFHMRQPGYPHDLSRLTLELEDV